MNTTFGIGWIPKVNIRHTLTEHATIERGGWICERGMTKARASAVVDKLNKLKGTAAGCHVPVFTYS